MTNESVWRAPRLSLRFWPVFLRNLLVWHRFATYILYFIEIGRAHV